MIKSLSLYCKLIRMNLLTGLQYKGWPIMILQVLFVVITDPIGLIFMFSRFGNIGEWSVYRILLIYAIAVTSFGLAETFCRGFDYFPWKMIRSGDFDRLLLRPSSLIIQVAGSYFHIHRIARVFGGACAIAYCLFALKVQLNLADGLILAGALLGGFLAYTGVFLFTSGLAFFTVQGLDWIYIFTNASYQVTRCPMDYMPKVLKYMFTFFMPILIISYYPASAICSWGDSYWKGFAALPAGLVFFLLSTFVWRYGVKHYKSTGS
ncbi:ABC-2 family transporter protein [Anaerocolumna sp. AGMB13025]|uniref:ABC transporter permease n=1 Tax=Anaerocolumna sp. AGMB13025 TaxID=3039116 RepID=UPI00241C227A|nr:ABC-2 family transporter protein [Anaerocolumna sp. AGMB13025]WFR59422.1 ABC-2 family transporter protein [Anaerocolumna sp. AGMB13025]